jgi:hypothetical protein
MHPPARPLANAQVGIQLHLLSKEQQEIEARKDAEPEAAPAPAPAPVAAAAPAAPFVA